jgi:hypothetical protein
MGGHTERDVALVLIEAAARSGKIHPDGLRVKVSWGKLQVGAKVARKTLAKALARLEERGLMYRDNEGRKADKTGAFVLNAGGRAKVDQVGRGPAQVTPELQTCGRGGLPLRGVPDVPRLRWSRPKFTPRRGLVSGTRRVRNSKPLPPRDRIERLGKGRGAVVDVLEAAGGTLAVGDIAELRRKRPRDLRRRDLPMLEEAGIVAIDGDTVSLTPDWSERLEGVRAAGGELEADELAERDRKRKSRGYHRRHETPKSEPSAEGLANVKASREKRQAYLADPVADTPSDAELVVRHRRARQLIREGMAPRFAEQAVRGAATVGGRGERTDLHNNVREVEHAPRKLPQKKGGIYVHGAECDCWLCDEEGVA